MQKARCVNYKESLFSCILSDPLASGDKIVITRPILLPSNTTLSAEQIGALTNTSVIDGGSF